MTDNTQPEALRLANVCSNLTRYSMDAHLIAAELRRQHARIAELEAELEAVGAGGVQALSAAPAGVNVTAPAVASEPIAYLYDDGSWTPAKTEEGRKLNDWMISAGSPKIGVHLASTAQPTPLTTLAQATQAGNQQEAQPNYVVSLVVLKGTPTGFNTQNKLYAVNAASSDEAVSKAVLQMPNDFPEHRLHTACFVAIPAHHPAPAPLIARSLAEWHEEDGYVAWWAWNGREWAGEPAWIGTPNCEDWPGYHTHWTPHPEQPVCAALAAQGGKT